LDDLVAVAGRGDTSLDRETVVRLCEMLYRPERELPRVVQRVQRQLAAALLDRALERTARDRLSETFAALEDLGRPVERSSKPVKGAAIAAAQLELGD